MKKILCSVLATLACVALVYIVLTRMPNKNNNNVVVTKEHFNQNQIKQIEQIINDFLMKNPTILIKVSEKLREQEMAKEIANEKASIQKINENISKYKKEIFYPKDSSTSTYGRVISGNPNGKIIIAEFTQYQCSHCKTVSPIVDKLLKNNPDVKLITIYWPFFGTDAIYASKAALASQKQGKFKELNNAMISSNDSLNEDKINSIINKQIHGINATKLLADINAKEITSGIAANSTLANNLGLMGTPTFIFTNNEMTKFRLIPGQTQNIENDLNKALKEVR